MKQYYVDRGGEQVYRPPFNAQGVDFFSFVVKADKAAMNKSICDQCLNNPSSQPGRYEMAIPYVMVVYNNIASLVSTDPPYNNRGHFPEHEGAIWTLVRDTQEETLFWFHPYIFVDNSYALSMGREIYGFPKALGEMTIPTCHTKPDLLATDTIVVPEFGPNAQASKQRLIEVKRSGTGDVALEVLESLEALGTTIWSILTEDSLAGDLELLLHELEALLRLEVDMIFLKQFRDVGNPALAVAQSIVSLDAKLTKLSGVALYSDRFDIAIGDFDSHPIRKDLGLPDGPIQSIANFWVGFDMWIGPGEQVWPEGDS
jgi:hypothetical protein